MPVTHIEIFQITQLGIQRYSYFINLFQFKTLGYLSELLFYTRISKTENCSSKIEKKVAVKTKSKVRRIVESNENRKKRKTFSSVQGFHMHWSEIKISAGFSTQSHERPLQLCSLTELTNDSQ